MLRAPSELWIAHAVVTAVEKRQDADGNDFAYFVSLELRHHATQTRPLTATARWAAHYHGADFGDWYEPQVGQEVLAFFAGIGPEGRAGDLDHGVVFAVLATAPQPMPAGQKGAVGAGRRVWRGRSGEARDELIRGDHDLRVEGNRDLFVTGDETREVEGTLDTTIGGDETSEHQGMVSRTFRAALEWTLESTLTFTASLILKLKSDVQIGVEAPVVLIGTAAVNRLMDERFHTYFTTFLQHMDNHVHQSPVGGLTSNPTQPSPSLPAVTAVATTETKAS